MPRESGQERAPSESGRAWALVARQHGVVARRQLLEAGLSSAAIARRVKSGRLHRVHTGVYAAGRPGLSRPGRWMAAVLRCGRGAVLSHASAAALWGMHEAETAIEVSVPVPRNPRPPGIRVHRRASLSGDDVTEEASIPVTAPVLTLIDLATRLGRVRLEAAVNAADKRGLIDPETLRELVGLRPGRRGAPLLRALLDRDTFVLTDSELERRFLRIVVRAGLPLPRTQARVQGRRVDFLWRALGLIVETDGLRYHRTAASQRGDRERDQEQLAAGYTTLRFTHAQVRFEPARVERTLAAVIARLQGESERRRPGA